ncbi:class IV aminotransferase [Streptomyces sp. R302]|uniref:aminotransferase class IV n=1 Tax=unclassified Streptomyces TaxID=2593676 RepID=UPI00145C6B37|nr:MULTISPECIES: aminotransferase class IV [unclassified Streptomyces]NML49217.1 class IV aminotransferase [Streptomyces sp. R301]NML77544.1 class IV aminotransferase [Streptomyces sp. R302]
MTTPPAPAPAHIEIDGVPAADPGTLAAVMSGYGHFTAAQVRDGRVKGLGLHLDRLDRATRELFGAPLPGERVRELLARALGRAGRRDASARVYVYEGGSGFLVAVTVREAAPDGPGAPQRLTAVDYLRPAAHLKHLGGFGQRYHGDAARRAGFDGALLTTPAGEVAEGAVANIAFWDGTSLVWPTAPHLDGVTMALLASRLPSVHRSVTVSELPGFRAAFVVNAREIAPVTGIDEVAYPVDGALMERVSAAYAQAPGEEIVSGDGDGSARSAG